MKQVRAEIDVSEQRACRVLGQPRSTQRRKSRRSRQEERLVREMVELAREYGRYGYRRITVMLRQKGWRVNHQRVERLWRREGLQVPQKQPKRKRLWLNDGSCIRRRPERKNHVWSYDFVQARTAEGRPVRLLTMMDEYTRECLAVRAERKLSSEEVMETLANLFVGAGCRGISVRTMGRSSWPGHCGPGWSDSRRNRCTSNRAVRGRTATSNRLTASCVMNY